MTFQCLDADKELIGNFRVSAPFGQQGKHLAFFPGNPVIGFCIF